MTDDQPILEVENLRKYFQQNDGILSSLLGRKSKSIQAVDDVSLTLRRNEVKGIIGESGCGKTTLLMTLLQLHDVTDGTVRFKGRDVSTFNRSERLEFRKSVQIIFQDPFNSLDPKMTVRESLQEPLAIHGMSDKRERVRDVLRRVELRPVDKYINRLPEQLSGGELQRVSIARALIVEPDVILADEPVSMLDVSTQAAILRLLSDLTEDTSLAMFYISHDLSTVSYVCDNINVMYLGRIVESAPTHQLIQDPKHPYTQSLINAVPIPDPNHTRERTSIEGAVKEPIELGDGCRFRDRCPERMEICEQTPEFVTLEDERTVACHLYYDHEGEPAAAAVANTDNEAITRGDN